VRESFGEDLFEWNLRVLCDVARAAAFAHEHGIVHRDIKPSNVMIGPRGEVTLLDWGVAAAWAEGDADLPQVDDAPIAGTLSYMAPEQLEGDAESQGPWSDVFQLGATLYQVLSGRPPFASVDPKPKYVPVSSFSYPARPSNMCMWRCSAKYSASAATVIGFDERK
jgi:serine/threonine protein kinase